MPRDHGYGVLLGTIRDYYRDPPDNFARYYHGNLILNAPMGAYHCAIDVDSHKSNVGVEWRRFACERANLALASKRRTSANCSGTTPPRPEQTEMKFYDDDQVKILLDTAKNTGNRLYTL